MVLPFRLRTRSTVWVPICRPMVVPDCTPSQFQPSLVDQTYLLVLILLKARVVPLVGTKLQENIPGPKMAERVTSAVFH